MNSTKNAMEPINSNKNKLNNKINWLFNFCQTHTKFALGNGGYQPNIVTFGTDQFEEDNPKEGQSKVAFFSYFYLALNIGYLFSNTILGYFENEGMWALGFWVSTGSAFAALVFFLVGSSKYKHFKPNGNNLS